VGGGIGFGKTVLYASAGYEKYKAVSSNAAGSFKLVPIKVGLRRYLLPGLFINGALGTAIQTYDQSSFGNSSFLYEAGAGIKFPGMIELGAAYTGWLYSGNTQTALLFKGGLAIKL